MDSQVNQMFSCLDPEKSMYIIKVKTSDRAWAGADVNVHVFLNGLSEAAGHIGKNFYRGQIKQKSFAFPFQKEISLIAIRKLFNTDSQS